MYEKGRSQWWIVQASIIGTCVAVALAAGIILIPRSVAPKPVDEAAPATAYAIRESMDSLFVLLDRVTRTIDDVTGVGADPVNETDPAGAQAYASTWLSSDDAAVTKVTTLESQCRTLINEAVRMLDPTKTLVGSLNIQANSTSTPQIVTMDQLEAMPTTLDDCRNTIEPALSTLNRALTDAKTSAAVSTATTQYTAELDSLKTAVDSANDALSSSTMAAAASARTALATQIDAATALVGAETPATWQDLDQQTTALTQAAQSLADAVAALEAVQPNLTTQTYTGGNGNLDPSTLCQVPYDTKQLLRCDAEAAWMRLDAVYKGVWGVDIPIDLSYRTYDEQVEMRQIYGSGAALTGTSNHGWGTAVDLPDYREGGEGLEWNYGTEKYEWMKANAPAYGWVNPSWAVEGGVGPHEPWHFEYVG